MRILQFVGDWRWTGPAAPMLVLSAALRARGHQVDLICPEPPVGANGSLWQEAALRQMDPIQPIEVQRAALRLGKRARRLGGWLETDSLGGPYDIVHCWHSGDHVVAARALGLGGPFESRDRRARVVRFLSHSEPIRRWPFNRWLLGAGCDGLICVSESALVALREIRGGRPTAVATGAIDLEELEVTRGAAEVRRDLGVANDAPLIGVVAPIDPHQRFDLLLAALARLVRTHPEARLVLIGRETRAEEVVVQPARAIGLEDNVVLAGYRVDDYADVLAALDLCTLLVPGSDGYCRALLQAAVQGLPMVGTRRGAIPEIISNGQTGWLVAEDPDALAAAWRRLIDDPARRLEMGEAARRDARERFRPDRHAAWMERFYEEVRAR